MRHHEKAPSHSYRQSIFSQKEHESFCILMLPVADQDLRSYLEICVQDGYPAYALRCIMHWFGCLLHALLFVHRVSVIHQDIKPSNALVKGEGGRRRIYLADFRMAKDFSDRGASATVNTTVRGTPLYRAPEVRPGQVRGRVADIFSLGCVFSEMLTVRCRRSLQEYQEFRRAPNDEVPLAFRAKLARATSWVHELGSTQDDDSVGVTVLLIRQMIKADADKRPAAPKEVQMLQDSSDASKVFCPDCV